jgi:hypothetical protein
MANQKLLREFYTLCDGGVCQDFLTEHEKAQVASGQKFFLTGVMQRADAQNGNGRIYPRTVLEREMKNYAKLIKERRATGELDHPESSVVELKNVSHLVTEAWWEGDDVMGKIEILNTPSGKILQELVKAGVTLGISSRGLGSTRQVEGVTMVEDDFSLLCYDMVSEPSTDGAFMMKESLARHVLTKADRINRRLNEILDS